MKAHADYVPGRIAWEIYFKRIHTERKRKAVITTGKRMIPLMIANM